MKTPELDKIKRVRELSQPLGELLEWLLNDGWRLMRYQEVDIPRDDGASFKCDAIVPDFRNPQQVLAEFYEIDLAKADEERTALLEEWRERQGLS